MDDVVIFYGHLVCFEAIRNIFVDGTFFLVLVFVPRKIWQHCFEVNRLSRNFVEKKDGLSWPRAALVYNQNCFQKNSINCRKLQK
jgi:hypothetical protein